MNIRPQTTAARRDERGQILVIFAGAFVALTILLGLVIDLGWFWSSQVSIQRAADAAALAGVVKLTPDSTTAAVAAAKAAAVANGYTDNAGGVDIVVSRDPDMDRRLRVEITAPVGTFFLRIIGINAFETTKVAEADYTMPVPMGSPDNAYGIFGAIRTADSGDLVTTPGNTGPRVATSRGTDQWGSAPATGVSRLVDLASPDNQYAVSTATGKILVLGNFGLTVPAGATVTGLTVGLEGYGIGSGTKCAVKVDLSANNGSTWTTGAGTGLKTKVLSTTDTAFTLGGASDRWARTSWTSTEIGNGKLLVRLTSSIVSPCTAVQIDALTVRVDYTTEVPVVDEIIDGPDGQALPTRGFWAGMLSQGALTSSGDAYLPAYQATGNPNAKYDPDGYYVYDVTVPPGRTGHLSIFDPGFCDGTLTTGVGDNWYSGTDAVDAYYDLYAEVNNTPYNASDDVLVWSSRAHNLFLNSQGSDPDLSGSGGTGIGGCDAYHLNWYEIPSLLVGGGAVAGNYRLHTYTTNPNSVGDQQHTNALNGFALFTDAQGGRIYGDGAMEMFTPLPGGQNSTFYLAQIDVAYAGRTMEIRLWDAGDTNQDANISILAPTATGWASTSLSWTAAEGAPGASSCTSTSPTTATNLITYSGGQSRFNGCWVTLTVPIPTNYTAAQSGWWKIQYSMTGSAGTTATDLTTWQVDILGNPVHLVVP